MRGTDYRTYMSGSRQSLSQMPFFMLLNWEEGGKGDFCFS